MTITALPTPPSRGQAPETFSNDADLFLNALPTMVTQINAATTNMDAQYTYVYNNVGTTTTNANQATSAANSAVTARNQIEVLFLGSKSSNPTTNNQGGALTVGCKYFNTTVGEDRVWTGTNWVASTAIGGTVAGLNVDGILKLKSNTWHVDSFDSRRMYFENDGSGNALRSLIRGNEFGYRNNADGEMFKVAANGGMLCVGQASLNSNGVFMTAHSVTVGGTNGGGNTVGLGVTPGGVGSLGQVGADSNHLFIAPNTYYATGNDRFAVSGAYAPKIRLFSSDNRILFQQTNTDIAGNAQVQYIPAEIDGSGVFIIRSRDGYGYASIQGNTSAAGFVGFYRPTGERTGYVGNAGNSSGSENYIVAENSHPWKFMQMAPRSNLDATNGEELPRLSQFPSSNTTNGYAKLPNGFIIQWGEVTIGSSGTNITLPVTFPNLCTSVLASCTTNNLARASIINNSTINVACNPSTPQRCYWIAVGY
jgi:hypothetical protein